MAVAACLVFVMRRRTAMKLAKQWAELNGTTLNPRVKPRINVFRWPVRVTLHTVDHGGNRNVVVLDIGDPSFGGWFRGVVTCVSRKQE